MEFDFTTGPYSGADQPRDEFPALLTYGDVAGAIWSTPEAELTLGVDGEGERVSVDLTGDSPHVLISAASGAGKSVTARAIATQGLIKGYTVIFLDAKRHSHRWAKNLPGVHYASTMPEIGNALVSVAAEMHRRNEVVEEWPGSVETAPVGNRMLVVFEELNATVDALADLDKQQPKGAYTSAQALGDIMFLGRAARVHMLAIAQYADAKTIKTSIRENFGVRILIKHSWEAWNMLVPRAGRSGGSPATPTAPGRGYVVVNGKARQTQLLYMDEEFCAEIVRSTAPTPERITHRQERRQGRDAVAAAGRAGRAI